MSNKGFELRAVAFVSLTIKWGCRNINKQDKYYAYADSFTEYITYTENDIVDVTEKGIVLKNDIFIGHRKG